MDKVNCDLAIIGSGSTGLSAVIAAYCKNPDLVIKAFGISYDSNTAKKGDIENIPGVDKIIGVDYIQKLTEQIEKFSSEFTSEQPTDTYFPIIELINENVISLNTLDSDFEIKTSDQSFVSKAVIISTGIPELKGTIKGEDEFVHKGVSHCAVCDGALFRGRKAVIVGTGNIVARGALFLRKYCRKITVLCHTATLECDKRYLKKLTASSNIQIKYKIPIDSLEVLGSQVVQGIKYKELQDEKELSADVIFVELKDKPNIVYAEELNLEITVDGYIKTNEKNATNVSGLFVAGTARGEKDYVPILMGDGYKAGVYAAEYLEMKS